MAEYELTGSCSLPPVLNFQLSCVLHIGEGMHCLQTVGRHSRHGAKIVGEEVKSNYRRSDDDLRIAPRGEKKLTIRLRMTTIQLWIKP